MYGIWKKIREMKSDTFLKFMKKTCQNERLRGYQWLLVLAQHVTNTHWYPRSLSIWRIFSWNSQTSPKNQWNLKVVGLLVESNTMFVCLIIFHYISGEDLPVSKSGFQMVSSADKKALYTVGGDSGIPSSANSIFKFHCPGDINTCRWTKSETTLRFGRSDFVAIPIPNSLADKLCKWITFLSTKNKRSQFFCHLFLRINSNWI